MKKGLAFTLSLLFLMLAYGDGLAAGARRSRSLRVPKRVRSHIRVVPAMAGVLVQTLEGETLLEKDAEIAFNPASVIKIATSYAALEKLGYDYRFTTSIYTNGKIVEEGLLDGDLIIMGAADPVFNTESLFHIVEKLRALGITTISGDLVIVPPFYLNFSGTNARTAESIVAVMEGRRWSRATARVWQRYLNNNGMVATEYLGVEFRGGARVRDEVGQDLRLLLKHLSPPLCDILKRQNDYSNNFMAEVIGRQVGGPNAIERFLIDRVGIEPRDIEIGTASGLGHNRMTPRAALKLMRSFYSAVTRHGKSIEALLPVGGIDEGTLEERFTAPQVRGSVVAKTGTLPSKRASALVGLAHTRERGPIFFAILHRDQILRARQRQDALVTDLMFQCGGPSPLSVTDEGQSTYGRPEVIICR